MKPTRAMKALGLFVSVVLTVVGALGMYGYFGGERKPIAYQVQVPSAPELKQPPAPKPASQAKEVPKGRPVTDYVTRLQFKVYGDLTPVPWPRDYYYEIAMNTAWNWFGQPGQCIEVYGFDKKRMNIKCPNGDQLPYMVGVMGYLKVQDGPPVEVTIVMCPQWLHDDQKYKRYCEP